METLECQAMVMGNIYSAPVVECGGTLAALLYQETKEDEGPHKFQTFLCQDCGNVTAKIL